MNEITKKIIAVNNEIDMKLEAMQKNTLKKSGNNSDHQEKMR